MDELDYILMAMQELRPGANRLVLCPPGIDEYGDAFDEGKDFQGEEVPPACGQLPGILVAWADSGAPLFTTLREGRGNA